MAKHVDSTLERAIVRAYQYGKDGASRIATEFGIGSTTVYRILDRRGIARDPEKSHGRRGRRFRLSEAQQVKLAKLYAKGALTRELAAQFECSTWLVLRIVKDRGFSLRRKGQQRRIWTESDVQKMSKLYAKGMSQEALAQRFKTHQTTVSRLLTKAGAYTGYPAGETHGMWKGGRIKVGTYTGVLIPIEHPMASMRMRGGYVLEHRLVMADHIGRPLRPEETVHHINGKRTDNRLENLQLRQGRHGAGAAYACADCGSHNIVERPLGDSPAEP